MILTLIGLFLSFIGSVILVYDTLKKLGKLKSIYLPSNERYGWKAEKLELQTDGFLEKVKYTTEEIILIISLSLLSLGFFLQILDFLAILFILL